MNTGNNTSAAPSEYFGALPKDKIAPALQQLERDTFQVLETRRVPSVWREIAQRVYNLRADGSSSTGLERGADDAGQIAFHINLTRPMVQQQIIMVQGQRKISFTTVAINNDFDALASVGVAQKALEYVVNDVGLDTIGYKALEWDRYFGRGSIWVRWDYKAGELVPGMVPLLDAEGKPVIDPAVPPTPPSVDPATGEVIPGQPGKPAEPRKIKGQVRSGAPKFSALAPWQCLSDTMVEDSPWCIVKEAVSKWELAAQFPEHATSILSGVAFDRQCGDMEFLGWSFQGTPKDLAVLRHFYHRDSDAVPGGRWVGYCAGKVLWDLPCPISQGLPVVDISTAQYLGTQIGRPEVTDLLSLQDAMTEVAGQVITNTMRFGNQNIYVPAGTEYDREAIARGGAILDVPEGKTVPKALEYASMSPTAKFILDLCPQLMEEIAGMNSVTRGQPSSNITSGTFAALMVNIAEKMQSPTQVIYDSAISKLGNMTLELIKHNAENGFMAQVAGAQNQSYMRLFTTDSLGTIHKVQVKRRDPITESFPARMEIMQAVAGMPKDMQKQSMEMLMTGNTDAITEDNHSQSVLINWENEQLVNGDMGEEAPLIDPRTGQPVIDPMTGQPVMGPPNGLEPLITDDPKLHCLSHRTSLDKIRAQPRPPKGTPERQKYDAAIKAHLLHLAKHGQVWKGADPVMTSIVGVPMPPAIGPDGKVVQPDAEQPAEQAESAKPNPKGKLQDLTKDPAMPKPSKGPSNLDDNSAFNGEPS